MTPSTHDDDIDLLNHYQANVPPDLRQDLLRRLESRLPSKRLNLRRLLGGVGLAASVALLAWLALSSRQTPNKPLLADVSTTHSEPAPPSARFHDHGISLGMLSLETQVSNTSLIVRARIVGWNDTIVQYAVERVIYGVLTDKTIKLDATFGDKFVRKSFLDNARKKFTADEHRVPTDDELLARMLTEQGIEKGHEVILLLQSRSGGGFQSNGAWFDYPPNKPLDKAEERFVQIIHDGGYLENIANPGEYDIFQDKMNRADAIVRATVLEVTPTVTRWRVDKVLKGTKITQTLEIPHDLFRLRAEAWVHFHALTDDSLKDPARQEAQIQQEISAMIKSELAPGRQAILFLDHLQPQDNTTRAELQYRLYDTSKRLSLKDLEDLITNPATTQDTEINL